MTPMILPLACISDGLSIQAKRMMIVWHHNHVTSPHACVFQMVTTN